MKLRRNLDLWSRRMYRHGRALHRGRDLARVADRTDRIAPGDILLLAVIRDEQVRLPWFLDYYRKLGVAHFLFVDNGSTDGSGEFLQDQPDCSIWHTEASYKRADFGIDWQNALLRRHACNHWVLTVDADEFFIYPYMESRPLRALTEWLDASNKRSFAAMLIDMYSEHDVRENAYRAGDDPFETLRFFDSGNYTYDRNGRYHNLWIQGGPRQRVFFADMPEHAPALNKIPLVKWDRRAVYVSSTHTLLPRGLNRVYDASGGELASGALLHAKLLAHFAQKAEEEIARGEHFADSREYRVYIDHLKTGGRMWTPQSLRFEGWEQLYQLGLISPGDWA